MKRVIMTTLLSLASCASAFAGPTATARMIGADGTDAGTVTLSQTANGVLVRADLRALTPGDHGFHIHETGSCDASFKAAGGHYNPHGKEHGFNNARGPHAGDMPNLHIGSDGTVKADVVTASVSLENGPATLFDTDGSAIMIHVKADTYGKDAGAGGRVACGVIKAD